MLASIPSAFMRSTIEWRQSSFWPDFFTAAFSICSISTGCVLAGAGEGLVVGAGEGAAGAAEAGALAVGAELAGAVGAALAGVVGACVGAAASVACASPKMARLMRL